MDDAENEHFSFIELVEQEMFGKSCDCGPPYVRQFQQTETCTEFLQQDLLADALLLS